MNTPDLRVVIHLRDGDITSSLTLIVVDLLFIGVLEVLEVVVMLSILTDTKLRVVVITLISDGVDLGMVGFI